MTASNGDAIAMIEKLYRRADAGDPDAFEDFAPDAQIYFPKFGMGRGAASWGEFTEGLFQSLAEMKHDIAGFNYIVSGNSIVVEGTTSGQLRSGERWEGGTTPGGRFVSVFELAGGQIIRMHIYTDPDYAGADEARFLWRRDLERPW
jgi:ketosteroid isomerase-like protein